MAVVCFSEQTGGYEVSPAMKVIDLTDYKLKEGDEKHLSDEQLQELELGQPVEHVDEGPGIIAALLTGSTEWFTDPNDEDSGVEIEASESEPVYIVALLDGGSIPADSGDVEPINELPGDGEDPEEPDDFRSAADGTELAEIYSHMDDPNSMEQLRAAKKKLIHKQHAAELAEFVDAGEMELSDLETLSYEELLNIPGVDDPHVGFASDPNGWTRKSYLQAWMTVGATWRSCRARMLRHFGNRMAKRWCAALKDEILQTERWRARF